MGQEARPPLCRCGGQAYRSMWSDAQGERLICQRCQRFTHWCQCPIQPHAEMIFLTGLTDGIGRKQEWT